jgi:hypothetical protein
MRSRHGNQQPSGSSEIESEFNFGYFYRTVEDHINAFAAQARNPLALADIADRVGELLRLKAATLRQQLGASELLLEMRQVGAAAGGGAADRAGLAAREALHVRSRARRTLSAKAIRAIKRAQKIRWAKFHAEQAHKPIKEMSAKERREYNRVQKQAQRAQTKGTKKYKNPALARFWASMTPAKRSKEAKRRAALRAANKAAKAVPLPPKANASNGAAVAVA